MLRLSTDQPKTDKEVELAFNEKLNHYKKTNDPHYASLEKFETELREVMHNDRQRQEEAEAFDYIKWVKTFVKPIEDLLEKQDNIEKQEMFSIYDFLSTNPKDRGASKTYTKNDDLKTLYERASILSTEYQKNRKDTGTALAGKCLMLFEKAENKQKYDKYVEMKVKRELEDALEKDAQYGKDAPYNESITNYKKKWPDEKYVDSVATNFFQEHPEWAPKPAEYHVHYYQIGTKKSVAKSETITGRTVGETITAKAPFISDYSCDVAEKSLKLKDSNNEIIFYYKPHKRPTTTTDTTTTTTTTTTIAVNTKSRTLAGVLGVIFGPLGIHNFYLGKTNYGVAQLLCSIICAVVGNLFVSFGYLWGNLFVFGLFWGYMEGVCILAGKKWKYGKGGSQYFDQRGNWLIIAIAIHLVFMAIMFGIIFGGLI